ncbi:MAG: sialidase family protein [Verrucomicrobiota bacterium]
MKSSLPALFILRGLGIVCFFLPVSFSALAQDWTITIMPQAFWSGVACSADGLKLVLDGYGSGIWVSTNRGATWVASSTIWSNRWSGITSSADGVKLAAVSQDEYGSIYLSTNSGNTWQPAAAPMDNYHAIASSPDGTQLAAASWDWGAYGIYTSSNSGASWALTAAVPLIGYFQSVAISADGTKLAAAGGSLSFIGSTTTLTGGGEIEYSTNAGATWHVSDASMNWEWSAIACSSNGNFMVAGAYGDTNNNPGPLMISTNAGANWMPTTAPNLAYGAVGCSADGTRITAGCYSSYQTISPDTVYASTNSGATWAPDPTLTDVGSLAYSADGTKRVATTAGGWLVPNYVAVSPPLAGPPAAPQLSIVPYHQFVRRELEQYHQWNRHGWCQLRLHQLGRRQRRFFPAQTLGIGFSC